MIDLTALAKELLEKGTVTITISISVGQPLNSSANAVQMVKNAVHLVVCERCGKQFQHPTEKAAARAIRSHRRHCRKNQPKQGKSFLEQVEHMISTNGAFRKD